MRFESVTAQSFGPFRGESLSLAPGLNVVYGRNEAGKSTWHAALYAALCGLRRGRGERREDKDFLQRHRPWGGARWQVQTTVVLADGRRVELDQDLDGTGPSTAIDLELGRSLAPEITNDGSPDGALWLGLDRRSFLATACIRQADILAITQQADLLSEHLQRSADTAGTETTAAAAIEHIDRFLAERVGSERSNSLRPLRQAQQAVEAARTRLQEANSARDSHDELVATLRRQQDSLDAAVRKLAVYQSSAATDDASAATRRLSRVREIQGQYPAEPTELVTDSTLGAQLAKARQEFDSASWRNTWASTALAGGLVAAVSTGLAAALVQTSPLIFVVAAVFAVLCGAIVYATARTKGRLETHRFAIEDALYEQAERIAQHQAHTQIWAEMNRLLGEGTVEDLAAEADRLQRRADELAKLSDPAMAYTLTLNEDMDARIKEIEAEVATAREARDRLAGQVQERELHIVTSAEAEENLAEAEAELERIRTLQSTLTTTRQFLERAEDRIHRGLAPVLALAVQEWLPSITAGRYTQVRVDPADLSVQVGGPDLPYQLASLLSHGTAEQVYLLLRVAMASRLTKAGEVSPLLLDDITVHADADRKLAILRTLHTLSQQRQIILFTQEQTVVDWAEKNLGANDRISSARRGAPEAPPVDLKAFDFALGPLRS
jgi:DNA repair exonuclease SbcCD ATPase subunit